MASRSKRAGDRWEREVAKRLNGKKQPTSGAFGTQHDDPKLTGDVVIKYPWWNKAIHVECKAGYGSNKSISTKREWVVKVRGEAERARRLAALALKFRDVRTGDLESAKMICFNLDTWEDMMKELEYFWLDYLNLMEKDFNKEG